MMDDGSIVEDTEPEVFSTAPRAERTKAFLARISR